jgi:hypothetical protein
MADTTRQEGSSRVLHLMAIAELRNDTEGQAYYRRKHAARNTPKEAIRALERRLTNVVHGQLVADQKRKRQATTTTDPGGQAGATTGSSAANSKPNVDPSEKSLPGTRRPRGYARLDYTPRPFLDAFPDELSQRRPQPPSRAVRLTAARTGASSTDGERQPLTEGSRDRKPTDRRVTSKEELERIDDLGMAAWDDQPDSFADGLVGRDLTLYEPIGTRAGIHINGTHRYPGAD